MWTTILASLNREINGAGMAGSAKTEFIRLGIQDSIEQVEILLGVLAPGVTLVELVGGSGWWDDPIIGFVIRWLPRARRKYPSSWR